VAEFERFARQAPDPDAQKSVKVRGEVLLDLYYEKSCFWAKALVAFGPFG
jgi:hypothetical protein